MNKQLRKYFPKKNSIEHLSNSQIKEINSIIHNARLASLDGHTPKEAFIAVYREEAYNNLMK